MGWRIKCPKSYSSLLAHFISRRRISAPHRSLAYRKPQNAECVFIKESISIMRERDGERGAEWARGRSFPTSPTPAPPLGHPDTRKRAGNLFIFAGFNAARTYAHTPATESKSALFFCSFFPRSLILVILLYTNKT